LSTYENISMLAFSSLHNVKPRRVTEVWLRKRV
jgi:hypothetical protein